MAGRDLSAHDSLRLLRERLDDAIEEASVEGDLVQECGVVHSVAVGPDTPFAADALRVAGVTYTVGPDYLQSESLVTAGHIGKGLSGDQVQAWLAQNAGKEVTVNGVSGILAHFIVTADFMLPDGGSVQLKVRSVRDGDEVSTDAPPVKVPLDCEKAEDIRQIVTGKLVHLQVAALLLCRALHVTELDCTAAGDESACLITSASLQIDETAAYLCGKDWGSCRFAIPFGRPDLPEEATIRDLDGRTGASLKFTLLNAKGRVWTLIAGGGASVVYTDTICEYGFAKELANYGEYSGDPAEEFVFEYARTILGIMTASPEPQGKILLIGGGVANFTDVASTFKGIVRALKLFGPALVACGATVWVRRGGPNYAEGLALMRRACEEIGVSAHVYGPEAHLTAIVRDALAKKRGAEELGDSSAPAVKIPRVQKGAGDAKDTSGVVRFQEATQAIVHGMQVKAVQRMLDFDTLCKRKTPSVAAIVNPTGEASFQKFMFGAGDVLIPVYTNIADAVGNHGKDVLVLVNFASFRSVYDSTLEALQYADVIKTHAIIAEGVPEALTRRLHVEAKKKGVGIIGPATVGGIMPGSFRIGNAGGAVENLLLAKLYRPGSVGYTTKSGGMSNELNNIVALNTDGVREGIAIGGDRWPGVRFIDVLLRFEADPSIKMMALLGEVGGHEEYAVAEALADGRLTKPLVAWCCGTAAEAFDHEVQFGHAGARARGADETAGAKNRALAAAGAHVPRSFDEYGDLIAKVYNALVDGGAITTTMSEPAPPSLPADFEQLKKKGHVRKASNFVCSISDDRGAEPTYSGVPISEIASDPSLGIGGVISLLWFRRRLPQFATKFVELCVVVTADHGPCVSGAHNTIVAARAGKDLVSSLISGLATIGPRFGGALDDAARMFKDAVDAGLQPADLVEKCKAEKTVIMGIGHRVKSLDNPDARVTLIKDFARSNFAATPTLDFALAVEAITTKKKANLILNVDGAIAVCFVDLLRTCGSFSKSEADELVSNGVLNGLFVASRTLGLIGHFLDQKRLKQPLYRHPYDDVTYLQ